MHAGGEPHISRWQSARPEAYSVATGQRAAGPPRSGNRETVRPGRDAVGFGAYAGGGIPAGMRGISAGHADPVATLQARLSLYHRLMCVAPPALMSRPERPSRAGQSCQRGVQRPTSLAEQGNVKASRIRPVKIASAA
jgi:hypothetical protein